jgi:prepilin peptidase CpaA
MAGDDWLVIAIALIAAAVGAATDLWKYRVYNILTVPLFLSGLAYHGFFHGWDSLASSAQGALFGFLVLILPYTLGLMGAGDVKLLAALGAWLGLPVTVVVFVLSSLASGLYATVLIVYRGKLRESWMTLRVVCYRLATLGVYICKEDLVETLVAEPDRRLRVIPYGAMIPVGVLGAAFWLFWIS